MTRIRERTSTVLALIGVMVMMLLSGIGQASANPDTYPADVSVQAVTPHILTTEDDVTLDVEITNTGEVPLEAITLGLHVSPGQLGSATDIDAWTGATPANTSSFAVDAISLDDPIEPGDTAAVPVTFTRAQLGAHSSDAGIRGVAVEVVARRGESGSRVRLGMGRTVVPWWGEREAHPLAVIAPVTGPLAAPDNPEIDQEQLEELTQVGGDLTLATDTLDEHEWLTPAIDHTLVERATATGPSGERWAADLQSMLVGRPLIVLPAYDVDLGVVSQDERAAELFAPPSSSSLFTTRSTSTISVGTTGPVTDSMVEVATNAGYTHIVTPGAFGEDAPPAAWVTSEDAALTVHHADPELSALFQPADSDPGDALSDSTVIPEGSPGTSLTAATVDQSQVAKSLLTIIGREEGEPLLVSLERDWISDPQAVGESAGALEDLPWFDLTDARTALEMASPEVYEPPSDVEAPGVLDADRLGTLLDAIDSVEQTAEITVEPTIITEAFQPYAVSALAVAGRANPTRQSALIRFAISEAANMDDPIQLVPGSVVNLISQSGELPVQLTNDLPIDAEVMVILQPDHPRLIAHPSEPVVVPGGGTATALVPVEAVGSGNVEVTVTIADAQGAVISVAETMTVRVRADWENVGTAVIGGVLALGLVFGIARTVRRGKGKSRARLASVPVDKLDADKMDSGE